MATCSPCGCVPHLAQPYTMLWATCHVDQKGGCLNKLACGKMFLGNACLSFQQSRTSKKPTTTANPANSLRIIYGSQPFFQSSYLCLDQFVRTPWATSSCTYIATKLATLPSLPFLLFETHALQAQQLAWPVQATPFGAAVLCYHGGRGA